MKFNGKTIQTAALLLLSSSFSAATTIEYLGNDATRGGQIQIQLEGKSFDTFAGLANIIVDGLVLTQAFCVDIHEAIWTGFHQVITQDPSTLSNGGRAAWLMQNLLGTVTGQISGAGMQLAIWDIVHDGGDGLSAGTVRSLGTTDGAIVLAANQYLQASAGQSSMSAIIYSNVNGRDWAQTIMTAGPESGVPEPGSMAMIALGAVAVALGAWRRRS
jgi:hypothetical protein